MNSSFTVDFANDHIRVRYPTNYEITPENQQRLWTTIGDACRKYNCHRVLAESPTLPRRKMSQPDAFKSAGLAAKAANDLRMAFLYPEEYQTDQLTEFFISVAYNHGVRFEFFSDRENALKWLCADCFN